MSRKPKGQHIYMHFKYSVSHTGLRVGLNDLRRLFKGYNNMVKYEVGRFILKVNEV